ncbi:MAG: hypothetical protein KIT84_38800 [Labilithrix sp.]|nr:hypothetical protein [Labilithrix sp.]MCW5817011.1 hypothetical protein [Labilithrix sp.]
MPSHHQKKLEKKKKQRLAAQKAARKELAPMSAAALMRVAAELPVEAAYMTSGWRTKEPKPVTVVLTRLVPGQGILVACAMVDRTCLGVKDGFAKLVLSREELHGMFDQIETAYAEDDVEDVPLLEAQSVVYHAIDYARSLGFEPHKDFPELLFGPRPETLLDTPLAKPKAPIYIAGPNDDQARILAKLEAARPR